MAGHSRPKDGVASARLCPAIYVFPAAAKDVDARDKPGHDEFSWSAAPTYFLCLSLSLCFFFFLWSSSSPSDPSSFSSASSAACSLA
jgi:hypothetical protein